MVPPDPLPTPHIDEQAPSLALVDALGVLRREQSVDIAMLRGELCDGEAPRAEVGGDGAGSRYIGRLQGSGGAIGRREGGRGRGGEGGREVDDVLHGSGWIGGGVSGRCGIGFCVGAGGVSAVAL